MWLAPSLISFIKLTHTHYIASNAHTQIFSAYNHCARVCSVVCLDTTETNKIYDSDCTLEKYILTNLLLGISTNPKTTSKG